MSYFYEIRSGSPTKNQITSPTGFGYDASGDLTADGVYTYTYDAEYRVISASGMTGGPFCYTYNWAGIRVEKAHASGGSCSASLTADVVYLRNIAGQTIAETDGTGSTTNANYHEYVFFGGRRIAQSNPSAGTVYYYYADHLGSTRTVTTATGTPCYEANFLPYGTENTPSGFTNTCSTNYKFTGYERDAETTYLATQGNDYAMARYYSSRLGRFMTGDPLGGDTADPQTLNRYAYTRNNPVNFIDPSGLSCSNLLGFIWCVTIGPPPDARPSPDPNGGNPGEAGGWGGGGYCISGPTGAGNCVGLSHPPSPPVAPISSKPAAPNPSPSQAPQTGSPLTQKPAPGVSMAACMTGELIENFIGTGDNMQGQTATTVAANVVFYLALRDALPASLPGPGWFYAGAAVLYDSGMIGKSYLSCRK